MTVRLPRLMDANLHELSRLRPSALSVSLNLTPLSTASMALPEGEPSVSVRQFAEVYGPDGSLGVYRVSSASTGYGKEQRISLEHGIVTLQDAITPADTEWTGSVAAIMGSILACQTQVFWQLGTVEAPGDGYTLAVNSGDALQALLDAAQLAEGYALFFDQSAFPWTVHLRKLPEAASCECRMSRNLDGVTITMDDANLCTRVVSEKLSGGYLDADTVSAWGVVAKYLSMDEDADPLAQAQRYLSEHKQPSVSIDADALALARLTGETLDSFTLGSKCRVALPDWNTVMAETIVTLSYPDLLSAPRQVRLTMATEEQNAATAIASVRREVQSTTRSVRDAHRHITETEDELILHADRITANAAQITLKASAADVKLLDERVSSAEISLDGAKAEIALKVDRGGVVSAINMSPESIKISSSKIQLDGPTIVGYLSGTSLDVNELDASEIWAGTSIHLSGDTVSAGSLYASGDISTDGSLSCGTATIAGCSIATMQAQDITVLTSVGVAMSYATAATPSGGSVEVVKDVSVSRRSRSVTFYTT